jgi:hypothetical protein
LNTFVGRALLTAGTANWNSPCAPEGGGAPGSGSAGGEQGSLYTGVSSSNEPSAGVNGRLSLTTGVDATEDGVTRDRLCCCCFWRITAVSETLKRPQNA